MRSALLFNGLFLPNCSWVLTLNATSPKPLWAGVIRPNWRRWERTCPFKWRSCMSLDSSNEISVETLPTPVVSWPKRTILLKNPAILPLYLHLPKFLNSAGKTNGFWVMLAIKSCKLVVVKLISFRRA